MAATSKGAMLACRDPVGLHWQLGELWRDSGRVLLIGWQLPDVAADSVVPRSIALAFANAMLLVGRLRFLASDQRRSFFLTRAVTIRSTDDSLEALAMFDDADFNWSLQGQVGIVTRRNSGAPLPGLEMMLGLADAGPRFIETDWDILQIDIVVRPGVDGDVIGVFVKDSPLLERVRDDLQAAAQQAGLEWKLLGESDFMRSLASR